MRLLILVAVMLAGCASHRVAAVPAVHPNEQHVIAETQRFASLLGVHVRAVITTTVYMVPASHPNYPGEKVPAAGWFKDGRVMFYRPVIQARDQAYGMRLAAHEACHAIHHDEAEADECAAGLLAPTDPAHP